MASYAAFLRGMNVGGHRLTNEELRTHFAAMGFGEVATFRASGNVVFVDERPQIGAPELDEVTARIQQGLAAALGYEVPTFIRAAAEMHAIAALRPFTAEQLKDSAGRLQVALFASAATPSVREAVLELADEGDQLVFGERELYWLPSGGLLESPLDLKAIAKLLGVMTMRTKGTIEQIVAKHFLA
jgi:uncharacterized protein (DUF1697 family)